MIPSRTYNVTARHWRQILCNNSGHHDTWNNKAIVNYDDLVRGVNNGEIFSKNEFKILEYNEHRNIVEVYYRGAWFMIDNGYLSWS